jgi:hypothetical protein
VKRRILREINLWLPVSLWAILIFHFSAGSVPVASAIYWQDFTIKKTGHFLLFGFLAILIYRALIGDGVSKTKAVIWAITAAFLYGASDEYHQMFTQGRESRIRDIFIDGAGAAIFVFFVYRFLPKLPKKIKIYAKEMGLI